MKKLTCLILVVLLLLAVPLTVFAAPDPVTDTAGLLTEEQDRELSGLLYEQGIGTLGVVALESLKDEYGWQYPGEDIEELAERWAESAGIGVLFMIDMEEHQWCITAAAEYKPVIDVYVIDEISAQCVPYLKSGDYYEAFVTFANCCTVIWMASFPSNPTPMKAVPVVPGLPLAAF